MISTNLSIDFDFAHYLPPLPEPVVEDPEVSTETPVDQDNPEQNNEESTADETTEPGDSQPPKLVARPLNKIVELDADQIKCQRIVVSVIADGLELGRQYTISYTLSNMSDDIFAPQTETFYASKIQQKFSTIAKIQDNKIYIMKVNINRTGSGMSASDMITVKCGLLTTCDTEPKPLSLSEYVKFDNKPVYQITEPYRCDSRIPIGAMLNNAKLGSEYSYEFSSLETDSNNQINFYPASGTLTAGSENQNFGTIAKFVGKSNFYCIRANVTDKNNQTYEDFLIIQCGACT